MVGPPLLSTVGANESATVGPALGTSPSDVPASTTGRGGFSAMPFFGFVSSALGMELGSLLGNALGRELSLGDKLCSEDGAVVGGNVGADVVGDAEGITLGSEVGDSVGTYVGEVVVGVSEGYKKELELIGVGYRASSSGQNLELSVGYSHPVVVQLPPEVKVTAVMEKGKPPLVTLEAIDKQLIGQVAARIRSIRKPEPYKGKGIKFKGEVLRRKAGKAAAAK